MKPLYNYDFTLKITGTGETPEEAYDIAVGLLMSEVAEGKAPEPDTTTRYNEPLVDTLQLECAVCGKEEEVRTDEFGDWMPEIYLGRQYLGACCPDCQLRYCEQDEQGMPEVILTKIDFQEGRCSNLLSSILDIINGGGDVSQGTSKRPF